MAQKSGRAGRTGARVGWVSGGPSPLKTSPLTTPGWSHNASRNQQHLDHQLVSGAWLVRWLAATVAFAALCGYVTICLLFYQGQWQVVFQPSRSITATPASMGLPYEDVRFDSTETGVAQLDGWWIPAWGGLTNPKTILFLHKERGSLSDAAPELKALHCLGVNVFAIDYRGFGQSMNAHPSERRVYEDAEAAMNYLLDVRHIEARSVVVYGAGLGATAAAETANRNPGSAGLVLEDAAPSGLTLIERDPRTRLLPVRLLFQDRFELAPKLKIMGVRKLFIEGPGEAVDYFPAAAEPKAKLHLAGSTAFEDPAWASELRSFLKPLTRKP